METSIGLHVDQYCSLTQFGNCISNSPHTESVSAIGALNIIKRNIFP